MGVTLSKASVVKIRQSVADTTAWRLSRGADQQAGGPHEEGFHALITGMTIETSPTPSVDNQRFLYSFLRIQPCNDGVADLWVGPLAFRFVDLVNHVHQAIELNNNPVPTNEIVKLTFSGYTDAQEADADGEMVSVRRPRFTFTHTPTIVETHLPIHDHRDGLHGGFAFAVFHPGTSLPQMPWAL